MRKEKTRVIINFPHAEYRRVKAKTRKNLEDLESSRHIS
jgi:hypothetical protein